MKISRDEKVGFPAFFVTKASKTEARNFVANFALSWLRCRYRTKVAGVVMFDIDDTLVDGKECVVNGFQSMQNLFLEACKMYPVHVVTARPDDDHDNVVRNLLHKKGFCVPTDRLHMLPAKLYGGDYSHIVKFKFDCYEKMKREHRAPCLCRLGDKLWDVAHVDTMRKNALAHVREEDTYIYMDPLQPGCISCKLPGV